MAWNYLQVEIAGGLLHPSVGPGGLTRDEAHAHVAALLDRHVETFPYASGLREAWDAGAQDDTVFAGPLLWAIYEADDPVAGAHAWVDGLARSLSRPRARVRVAW